MPTVFGPDMRPRFIESSLWRNKHYGRKSEKEEGGGFSILLKGVPHTCKLTVKLPVRLYHLPGAEQASDHRFSTCIFKTIAFHV